MLSPSPSRRQMLPRSLVIATALAGVGALIAGAGPGAKTSGADPGPAAPTTSYYLALGGSESVGVQPNPTSPRGAPTDQGYTDDLTATERTRWPGLQLVHLGCPGETAASALEGGGPCRYAAGSQSAAAVEFLGGHPGATVLATVDFGFNDLRPCLAGQQVDASCVATTLAEVGHSLSQILAQLRAAGGPGLHLVAVEKYDPYLGDYTDGPARQAFALATVPVIAELNDTIADAVSRAGGTAADIPLAFDTDDRQPTALDGYGTLPADVARACSLTWACADSPFPHNVHPNSAGYRVIAGAIASALGNS